MKHYVLDPEVAGQLGDGTVIGTTTHPPLIHKLTYAFDDWLGDDLIASFPYYLCSERLGKVLIEKMLKGFAFDSCEITKSELFYDLNENDLELPHFYWFKVIGNIKDDFYMSTNNYLVVSEKALEVLRKFNIEHCDIEEYLPAK